MNKKLKGFDVLEKVPDGWVRLDDAQTAPLGYSIYSNGKSRFGKEYKSVLVKDENDA